MSVSHDILAKAYKAFFSDSEAGRHFMDEVTRLLVDNHEKAEKEPSMARDFVQRAKGNREVLDHIRAVGVEVKKGRFTQE